MTNSILYFEEHCINIFEKLEDNFLKNPKNFAEYVYEITDLLHKLGTKMIQDSLEAMDHMLCESPIRKKSWIIEAHHTKTLLTSLGEVHFQKTLFSNKKTKESSYLLDQVVGLEPNQRMTEDVIARMLKEAVQTSYQRAAQHVSLRTPVTRETVKNKIHALKFPPVPYKSETKKTVDWLYIDADEDHVALQFNEKKETLRKEKME